MTDWHEHEITEQEQVDLDAETELAEPAAGDATDDNDADESTDAGESTDEVGDAQVSAAEEAAAPIGELVWADPRELVIGRNPRLDPRLDRSFISSIKDRGVREKIIARRRAEDGALVVRKGKRRTLAAIEAGRLLVPVLIEPDADPAEDDTAGQIERVVDQLEENDHRIGNTDAEHVGAVQELLDLGLSVTAIAKRTHRSRPQVKAAATVAGSEVAAAALSRYDNLTLDRAAVVAEFDDGTDEGTEAVKALVVTAQQQPGQFEHLAQRLRDERERRRRLAERVAELTATGLRVVTEGDDAATPPRISGLRPTAADPSGTELTEDAHRDCPGHAALVSVRPSWGDRPAEVITSWVCTDAEAHGHIGRWDGPSMSGTRSVTGARLPGPLSEEEKAERRRTIDNNKAWESATTVRLRWLRETFLPRRTAPKNATQFIAATLARGGHHLRRALESGHPTACELLGMPPVPGYRATSPIAEAAGAAAPARATMLTLAVLLGAAEQATSKSSWREPIDPEIRAYFCALRDWGYPLAPVEQLVLAADAPAGTDDTDDVDGTDGPAPTADAVRADGPATAESVLAHAGEPGPDGHRPDGERDSDGDPDVEIVDAVDGPDTVPGRDDGGEPGGEHAAA